MPWSRGTPGTAGCERSENSSKKREQSVTPSRAANLEARFLDLLDNAGLPRPQVNTPVTVGNGHTLEPDCTWPHHRLIVELDGYASHTTRRAFERDRARDRRLQAAGWRVIRITWRQLHADPDAIADEIRALLESERPKYPSDRR